MGSEMCIRDRVNVEVDEPGLLAESIEPAGDAVVEARADADHEIGMVHRLSLIHI